MSKVLSYLLIVGPPLFWDCPPLGGFTLHIKTLIGRNNTTSFATTYMKRRVVISSAMFEE
jgi:hypothetical protein